MKQIEKETAIKLRKKGLTYNEILARVPVAKSSLSLWLRRVGLAKRQIQLLTEKKKAAQRKGALARRETRLRETKDIFASALKDVGTLSKRELWLIGTVLYWAEGGKEKTYRPTCVLDFSNTDAGMIYFFVQWLIRCCGIATNDIYAHLYIHQYQKNRVQKALKYWSKSSGLPVRVISGVYFKRHNPKTKRYNVGELYYGTLRVRVRRSTAFVRKIQGWTNGICAQNWEVV